MESLPNWNNQQHHATAAYANVVGCCQLCYQERKNASKLSAESSSRQNLCINSTTTNQASNDSRNRHSMKEACVQSSSSSFQPKSVEHRLIVVHNNQQSRLEEEETSKVDESGYPKRKSSNILISSQSSEVKQKPSETTNEIYYQQQLASKSDDQNMKFITSCSSSTKKKQQKQKLKEPTNLHDRHHNHEKQAQAATSAPSKKQAQTTGCHKCQLIIDWTRAQANMASKIQQLKQQQQISHQDKSSKTNKPLKSDCLACKKKQDHLSSMGALVNMVQKKDQEPGEELDNMHRNNNQYHHKSDTKIKEILVTKSASSQHQHTITKSFNDNIHLSDLEDNANDPDRLMMDSLSSVSGEPTELSSSSIDIDNGSIEGSSNNKIPTINHKATSKKNLASANIIRQLPQRLSARLTKLVSSRNHSSVIPPATPPRIQSSKSEQQIEMKQQIDPNINKHTNNNNESDKKSPKRRQAPMPPERVKPPAATEELNRRRLRRESKEIINNNNCDNEYSENMNEGEEKGVYRQKFERLLTEQEVTTLEHALKSHKSSLYVAGCLANLYLTTTKLSENGRKSKPERDEWQLKQTGVPILTFDSGLARNRRKRQLKINLTERESGFVLWSDTIDHLSNYHADKSSSRNNNFHIMYLSHDHRLMAGLSFDDPTCASLFLAQIELVTADPRNISLTGPKLITSGHQAQHNHLKNGSKSSSSKNRKISQQINPYDRLNLAKEPVRYGWSTLKRAMRRQSNVPTKLQTSDQNDEEDFVDLNLNNLKFSSVEEKYAYLEATRLFRLKPLPALAAAGGRHFGIATSTDRSTGSKLSTKILMPRKCDISAPCLFQHITRVSRNQLTELHALSNYLNPKAAQSPITQTKDQEIAARLGDNSSNQDMHNPDIQQGEPKPRDDWRRSVVADRSSQSSSKNPSSSQLVDTPCVSGSASSGFISSSSAGCPSSISSSSSSTSCASTASSDSFESPTVSECGETRTITHHQRKQTPRKETKQIPKTRSETQNGYPVKLGRPNPPLRMQQPPPPPPTTKSSQNEANSKATNNNSGETKIHAMIRELESHASAETVCAKRRLMADIAGQLERARKLKSSPFEVRKVLTSEIGTKQSNHRGSSSLSSNKSSTGSNEPSPHVSRL